MVDNVDKQVIEKVAKAWASDQKFRENLRKSPNKALNTLGIKEDTIDKLFAEQLSKMSDQEISAQLTSRANKGCLVM